MAWYDEAVFYHIYPLGLAGAPHENAYEEPVHRLCEMMPWIDHVKEIGCNAIYIGPLFESVSHGYDTTDYYKLDSRLGTNEDLKLFVQTCHEKEIRVIFDGVFNHVGRDFFAFQDVKQNRENSRYTGWFCNLNFWNNNEYNDGFSYDNWGGHNQLVKLNQQNPEVCGYLCDVIRFWVSEFDIDGLRLDAADVLDFGFMGNLRGLANEIKPEFWLMGEVIHGEYIRWVNDGMLHSVTDYSLHKALYSGHNDHNYFEIAHTVKRIYNDMGLNRPGRPKLYDFVDNHDVERIVNKLNDRRQLVPVYTLLYTLPGIPSLYYGSEFGIEGRKEYGSDWSLRPALQLEDFADALEKNELTKLIAKLGQIRQSSKALCYGEYRELVLTNRQFAFARVHEGEEMIAAVNNDEQEAEMYIQAQNGIYKGLLSGEKAAAENGKLHCVIAGQSGELWIRET
ncbi:MAG: alpha-amylase [Eubacterium sp.]|nr:alpha-amylase [Eubacterium sp.]